MRPSTPPSRKQPRVSVALHGSSVLVSRMYGNGLPLASRLCEKSPVRSRAVGTVTRLSAVGSCRRWNSWLKKKKSFFLSSLNLPGMYTGPPSV